MRILYHHRTQAGDAQGIHICEIVKAFKDLGHEVDVVALVKVDGKRGDKLRGNYWEWIADYVPRWLYELMSLAYNLYGYGSLRRAITLRKPDLIYERYALNTFCGIWASRQFGIPLILEVNAPLFYEQASLGRLVFRRFARFAERWICSNSTRTIVVSHVMKEFLTRNGVCGERIAVIPNGIDPYKFHPGISGNVIRQKYGLEGKLVIGFVGWFRTWHGLEMLLKIMSDADLGARGIRLLLVGDGPAYADLYSFAKSHHLLPFVVFTGPVAWVDIPEHIAAMDIAVQPSVTEYACPIKIIEYMGMAKCIVAPNQPNICEILKDGTNGFLFNPADEEDFKGVLIKASESGETRQRLGYNAYQVLCKRRFLWSANAAKALTLI
jgi:glycosyltransferase involved in cell wall biosynthesis